MRYSGVCESAARKTITPRRKSARRVVTSRIAMSPLTDFRQWLWSDWGRPTFLTRMGIPRIVTNFLSFLFVLVAWVYLTLRYAPATERGESQLFVHNPFFLAAYAALYTSILTREFLSFKYKVKGRTLDKVIWENRSEPFVRVAIVALASSLLLILIGSLVYRSQLK